MPYRLLTGSVVLAVLLTGLAGGASAQVTEVATRPRFLAISPKHAAPVDASDAPVLQRRVSVSMADVTAKAALEEIGRQAKIKFLYSDDLVRLDRRVTLEAKRLTVAAALTEVLIGTGVDILVLGDGQLGLMRKRDQVAVFAQGTITGRVTDRKTGMGVPEAEVFLEGTRWRTTTDTGGRYALMHVDSGAHTLTVRRLGYGKQSQAVAIQEGRVDTVNVVLEPMATRLQELVTTATGQRRRLDVANDVTTINADSVMQAAPIRSVTDLLESRVPGLTVQHTSGAPGDPSRLRLRGASSPLRSNDPIVIVDGIRVYSNQSASRSANLARRSSLSGSVDTSTQVQAGYTSATPSPLDYIDPNSIETIEVLKGPSAATLYGQDAANGVIVITTKKGKAGPPQWTASAEHGRTHIAGSYPDLFWDWGHAQFANTPTLCPVTSTTCTSDSILTFQMLNDPALTVLDKGHRNSASLSVSGGSAALTYALTGSYQDEVGVVRLPGYEADRYQELLGVAPPAWMQRPQNYNQWSITNNVSARLGEKANVSLMTSLARTQQQKSSLQDQLGTLMTTFLDRSSGVYYQSAQDADGISEVDNALAGYFERATDAATQLNNHFGLSWRPQGWLSVTADAGLNVVHRADELYFPRGPAGALGQNTGIDTTGYVSDGQGTSISSTVNLRANAAKPLGRGFQFQVAAGINYAGTSTRDVTAATYDLAPGTSAYGSKLDFTRQASQFDATFGYYLEPSVGNSKFNFSSGLRLDGGNSYGANQSGLSLPKFPKLGFSYIVSDESWFPFKNLFQSFRVRVSYGRASRQPGLGDELQLYGIPQQVFADGQSLTGISLATLGNPDLRPERTGEFEGGFDADFFDNRVSLTVTGYRKTTDDALLSVPVAPSVYGGSVSIIKNIGVTRNTGIDMALGAQLIRSGSVTWRTQVGLSQRRDVVVKLGPGVEPFYLNGDPSNTSSSGSDFGIRIAPGYPLDGRWSRPILGYADVNGDGVLQQSEVQLGDTAVYVGSTLPNYEATISTTLSLWHGVVTVDAGLSYQDGFAQRNTVAQKLAVFARGNQVLGTPLGEQAATILLDRSDYNWVQTVNTTRFNSLSVGYRVPYALARRLGAQALRIAVQGGNLGLWTNYRGLDPNVNAFGTGNNVTDTGVLPLPRTWQVRVNATY